MEWAFQLYLNLIHFHNSFYFPKDAIKNARADFLSCLLATTPIKQSVKVSLKFVLSVLIRGFMWTLRLCRHFVLRWCQVLSGPQVFFESWVLFGRCFVRRSSFCVNVKFCVEVGFGSILRMSNFLWKSSFVWASSFVWSASFVWT